MKPIIAIIIAVMAFVLLVFVVNVSLDKNAKVDCLHWQQEAQNYQGFYLTHWQAEQCKSVNIIINAPIK